MKIKKFNVASPEVKVNPNYKVITIEGGGGGGGGGGDDRGYPTLEGIYSVCHRGYRYNYSDIIENTMPAFKMALRNGYNFLETDIRHTRDGVAVLCHDETLYVNETNRLIYIANVDFETLSEYTYENSTLKIPTLREFMQFCKDNYIIAYLEIKDGTDAQIRADYELIRELEMENHVVWISFEIEYLRLIKSIDRYATLNYVVNTQNISETTISDAVTLKNGDNTVGIDLRHDLITQEFVNEATAQGIRMGAWTVNSPLRVLELNELGVVQITTDYLKVEPLLEKLKTITSNDLSQCAIKFGNEGIVDTSSTTRITYIGLDIKLDTGKKYLVRLVKNPDVSKTIQFGVQVMNGAIYRSFRNGTTSQVQNTNRYDSGWKTDSYIYDSNPNYAINGLPPAFAWITCHYTDNTDILTSAISKIEIAEISELVLLNCNGYFY